MINFLLHIKAKTMLFGYGTFVVRTNMKRSGSFGILFITHKTNERINPEDVIRHEYACTCK